jgi:3-isopropylmalate/(R)-2-methylmalate dehydratase small subunit
MKRRGFLQLLGSAMTAPLMPALPVGGAAVGTASKAAYPALAMKMALAQAKHRVNFSVFSMAQQLGLQIDQANALMVDLSKQGVIGPIQGATKSGRWARSQLWQRPEGSVVASSTAAKDANPAKQPRTQNTPNSTADRADATKETTMEKFDTLSGIAAPMPLVNIDTDMIIPKVFLKTIKRTGLGANLFDEMRFDRAGNEIDDFVLNKPAYREAQIIVAGDNFGCGSSREHAPWALADFGIKSVISTSFADIFYNNCFKNGILPIVLPREAIDVLMKDAEKGANARMDIDLVAQTVTTSDGEVFTFEVDSFKKHCLLQGLDDIGLTMEKVASIDTFEAIANAARPWV